MLSVRIDRKRKLPVTSLLYALGLDGEEILNTFFNRIVYTKTKDGCPGGAGSTRPAASAGRRRNTTRSCTLPPTASMRPELVRTTMSQCMGRGRPTSARRRGPTSAERAR